MSSREGVGDRQGKQKPEKTSSRIMGLLEDTRSDFPELYMGHDQTLQAIVKPLLCHVAQGGPTFVARVSYSGLGIVTHQCVHNL